MEHLRRAGWRPGRSISTADAIRALAEDYTVWPAAVEFLAEFDQLNVTFMREDGRPDTLWVNAAEAARQADSATIHHYESLVGARLLPVGYAFSDHMVIALGEDGRCFGGYDDLFATLGSDFVASVDAVVNGRVVLRDTRD